MKREKIIEVLKKHSKFVSDNKYYYVGDEEFEAIADELLEGEGEKKPISNRQKKRIIIGFFKWAWKEEYDKDIEKEIAEYLRPLKK